VKALLFTAYGNPAQDLFTCSMTMNSTSVALRSARENALDEVVRILRCAVELKPTGHHLLDGRSTRERSMYQIRG
jgi:hypothetical protein